MTAKTDGKDMTAKSTDTVEDAVEDAVGLTEVSTDDLRQLAEALASGALPRTFTPSSLALAHFGHLSGVFESYAGLGRDTVLAVVRAVLAERRGSSRSQLDVVWSGADAGPSYVRYTQEVVPEMIQAAERQITIAGYSFDQGAGIFDHLHMAMRDRQVAVRLFLDVHQVHQRLVQQLRAAKRFARLKPMAHARSQGPAAFAREVVGLFRELHWPYEGPAPALFYDPRTAEERSFVSLHAKCLIVDYKQVLITSANFTGRGQTRNIEVGILVHDRGYAAALEQQWNNLVNAGDVVGWQ